MVRPTEELVARAQQGDRSAFERLVELHADRVRLFVSARARLHLGPPIDVEDVLQETLLRGWESVGRFQWAGEDSFFNWLCGIAKHVLMRTAAKHKATPRLEDAPGVSAGSGSAGTALRREERWDRLQRSIDALSPDYRRVVILARIEGLKIKEIAARMNRSPDSVKHLLARALTKLRSSLGDTESFNLPDRQLRLEEDDDGPR